MVGASGAISGVLGFYFLWFPRNQVRLLCVLPPFLMDVFVVPARIVLGLYLFADNLLPYLVARDAGADGITVVNTLPGLLHGDAGVPRLGNGNGGVSGPALLPIGVLATARVIERTDGMPVIGCGGVRSADDVRLRT